MDTRNNILPPKAEIGRIFFHIGHSAWCRVAMRSGAAAQLSVVSPFGIPEHFVLVIVDTGERFLAETVRREAQWLSVRLRAAPAFGIGEADKVPASGTLH
jgi:hypothetical protein